MTTPTPPTDVARDVTIDRFLASEMADDVRRSLAAGIAAGAVFEAPGDPELQFRAAVARALRAIESHDREQLLPRFLSVGPYEDAGPIPDEIAAERLSDAETAAAIRLIFSSAVSSFQGALAEMLAVGPMVEIARMGVGDDGAVLYVGDAVLARKPGRSAWAKAADFHILRGRVHGTEGLVDLVGVGEVKSFPPAA